MSDTLTTPADVSFKSGLMALSPSLKIHVRAHEPQGFTKTVLCMHGAIGSSADFDVLARSLAAKGCRVLAYDRPGIGYTLLTEDYLKRGYVINLAILHAFMKSAGGVDTVVCSSGGASYLHAYLTRKDGEAGLAPARVVYCEPGFEMNSEIKKSLSLRVAFAGSRFSSFEQAKTAWLESGWDRVAFGSETQRDEFLKHWLFQIGDEWIPAVDRRLMQAWLKTGEEGQGVDALRMPASFQGQVLYLYSADRLAYHMDRMAEFKRSYPQVALCEIEGSAHPLSLTTERELSAVTDFIVGDGPGAQG